MPKKRKKQKKYGAVVVITIMILFVGALSLFLNLIGFDSSQTIISNKNVETTLIVVKNLFSSDGLKFVIGKAVSNFRAFEPLVLLIISLFGISICEKSGFFNAMFNPLKRVKLNIIIFLTVFLGIISTIIGDYSYIFLIPLIGSMYKYLGKNPILGVFSVFLGITLGYGTGLIFNYTDYSLAQLTQLSARVSVDSSYDYNLFSNIYIMITSSIIMPFLLTTLIERFLAPKINKRYIINEEEQELVIDKKAKTKSFIVGLVYILVIIYTILPIKLPGAGILLDSSADRYMDQLFGSSSPFNNGLSLILTALLMLCGYVYGKISGNIKNGHEFSLGLSKNFENLGFMFVLMFFISELISIIEWTNIGTVFASKLIELIGSLQLSGFLLIITFFIVVVLMSILLPGTIEKWKIASPVMIPLFMQSNISPAFTQFIFRVADGVGKAFTPVFAYYIIMLAFLEKYKTSEKNQISIFGILKDLFPIIMIMAIAWLVLIIIWYILGLPIGMNTLANL